MTILIYVKHEYLFGKVKTIGVHRKIEDNDFEYALDEAFYDAERDGFKSIFFYVPANSFESLTLACVHIAETIEKHVGPGVVKAMNGNHSLRMVISEVRS